MTVMRRLVKRTVSRRLRKTVLWNGNLEPPLRAFFTDREHIIRWGWRTHGERPGQVREALRQNPGLQVVELRNQRELERWLARL